MGRMVGRYDVLDVEGRAYTSQVLGVGLQHVLVQVEDNSQANRAFRPTCDV